MPSNQYAPLATDDTPPSPIDTSRPPSYVDDPRFREPKVAAWKRIALIVAIIFMFYAAVRLRSWATEAYKPEDIIVHADRYSNTHKYRPAASPIIRRRLPDGRIEVRGDYHRPDDHGHRRNGL